MSDDREFWGIDWENEEQVKRALRAWSKRISGDGSYFEYYDRESYSKSLEKMSFSEIKEALEKDFRNVRFYEHSAPAHSGCYLFKKRYETAKQEMLKRNRHEAERLISEHKKMLQEDSNMIVEEMKRRESDFRESLKHPPLGKARLYPINPKIFRW